MQWKSVAYTETHLPPQVLIKPKSTKHSSTGISRYLLVIRNSILLHLSRRRIRHLFLIIAVPCSVSIKWRRQGAHKSDLMLSFRSLWPTTSPMFSIQQPFFLDGSFSYFIQPSIASTLRCLYLPLELLQGWLFHFGLFEFLLFNPSCAVLEWTVRLGWLRKSDVADQLVF